MPIEEPQATHRLQEYEKFCAPGIFPIFEERKPLELEIDSDDATGPYLPPIQKSSVTFKLENDDDYDDL